MSSIVGMYALPQAPAALLSPPADLASVAAATPSNHLVRHPQVVYTVSPALNRFATNHGLLMGMGFHPYKR